MMQHKSLQLLFITLWLSTIRMGYAQAISSNTIAPMLKEAMPAIVNVKAQTKITNFNLLRELQKERNRDEENKNGIPPLSGTILSVASGIIIDATRGYIITNAH